MLKSIAKILEKIKYRFEFIDLGGGMGISYDNKVKSLDDGNLKATTVFLACKKLIMISLPL